MTALGGLLHLPVLAKVASRCHSLPPCVHPTPQVVLYVGGFTKPDIQLFSAAGHPLGRVLWDSRARVVAAGWTRNEQLLVVDDAAQVRGSWTERDGSVAARIQLPRAGCVAGQHRAAVGGAGRPYPAAPGCSAAQCTALPSPPYCQVHMFNVRGERVPLRFSLGAECEAAGVEAAAVFQDGLAVLTPGGQLWCGEGACCGFGEAAARLFLSLHAAFACKTEVSLSCHWQPCTHHGCFLMVRHTYACLPVPPIQTRCVPDVHEPRLQRFPDPAPGLAVAAGSGGSSGVHCMTVLPPSLSSSGALEVRAGCQQGALRFRALPIQHLSSIGSQNLCLLAHTSLLPLTWAQVIVAVEETVRVIDANEALPTSVFEGPILR